LKKYEQYGDLKFFERFLENEKKHCSNNDEALDPLPDVVFSEDQERVRQEVNGRADQTIY